MGKPRWARILAITAGSSMAAMIVKGPPSADRMPCRSRTPVGATGPSSGGPALMHRGLALETYNFSNAKKSLNSDLQANLPSGIPLRSDGN